VLDSLTGMTQLAPFDLAQYLMPDVSIQPGVPTALDPTQEAGLPHWIKLRHHEGDVRQHPLLAEWSPPAFRIARPKPTGQDARPERLLSADEVGRGGTRPGAAVDGGLLQGAFSMHPGQVECPMPEKKS
jgi:hypothetical protein